MATKRSKKNNYCGVLANKMVREFLMEIAGENSVDVLAEITEPMSDDDLASVCELKVSDVRSVLNKLHNYGLADYIRTRDKDSGWYSYTWYPRLEKAKEVIGAKWKGELDTVDRILVQEEASHFFECRRCKKKPKMAFETASESMFRCDACNAKLKPVNNQKLVGELNARKERLLKNSPFEKL